MKNSDNVLIDERIKILKMVEDGNVSPGEGASLLSALGPQPKEPPVDWVSTGNGMRFLRVRVTDLFTGRRKATVTIPMGLLEWGFKIGKQFAPEIGDIDLEEMADVLQSEVEGKIVDVVDDEEGEHVEIYID